MAVDRDAARVCLRCGNRSMVAHGGGFKCRDCGAEEPGAPVQREEGTAPMSDAAPVVEWGEYRGRKRKPCPEDPMLLAGQPIGQYHCPCCGMMVVAGVPHLSPHATDEQRNHPLYPLDHYEDEYGEPWPAGYEDAA